MGAVYLFKLSDLQKVKVVAAKDYFCRTPLMAWFSTHIIGVIPIDRSSKTSNPIKPILEALDKNQTVIIFPEGSRGSPEQQAPLKYGISKILEDRPTIKITPIYMHGLGKALPKGEALLVPFICDINIGPPISWKGDKSQLIQTLQTTFESLKTEIAAKPWQ